MADFIQLEKDSILRLKIRDVEGNETGECLEFDLEDIELPLKYQELLEQHKKNISYLRNQFIIIDKRQDIKGKKLMSKNEEDKIRTLKNFFDKEEEILNMFLGENGCKKLTNGRNLNWSNIETIMKIINEQIQPKLDITKDEITKKIKEKYGDIIHTNSTNSDVLK